MAAPVHTVIADNQIQRTFTLLEVTNSGVETAIAPAHTPSVGMVVTIQSQRPGFGPFDSIVTPSHKGTSGIASTDEEIEAVRCDAEVSIRSGTSIADPGRRFEVPHLPPTSQIVGTQYYLNAVPSSMAGAAPIAEPVHPLPDREIGESVVPAIPDNSTQSSDISRGDVMVVELNDVRVGIVWNLR
tara:strand:- start:69 stop:623 length:555 start_codon:yes stop_codon:yes gene_type:complete